MIVNSSARRCGVFAKVVVKGQRNCGFALRSGKQASKCAWWSKRRQIRNDTYFDRLTTLRSQMGQKFDSFDNELQILLSSVTRRVILAHLSRLFSSRFSHGETCASVIAGLGQCHKKLGSTGEHRLEGKVAHWWTTSGLCDTPQPGKALIKLAAEGRARQFRLYKTRTNSSKHAAEQRVWNLDGWRTRCEAVSPDPTHTREGSASSFLLTVFFGGKVKEQDGSRTEPTTNRKIRCQKHRSPTETRLSAIDVSCQTC